MYNPYEKMDWDLLRQQKETLLELISSCPTRTQAEHVDGVIGLIDNIQDDAVDNHGYNEVDVFGKGVS